MQKSCCSIWREVWALQLTRIPCRQSVEIGFLSWILVQAEAIALDLLMLSVAAGSAFFVGLCSAIIYSLLQRIYISDRNAPNQVLNL
jgi:hypothetical protein